MKWIISALLLLSVVAQANITAKNEYLLNDKFSNQAAQNARLGTLLDHTKTMARVTWNFAIDGGAKGLITPRKGLVLPAGAIITNVYWKTVTSVTGGANATLGLQLVVNEDLMQHRAVSTLTAGTLQAGVPINTLATFLKLSTEKTVKFATPTASLTAGKVDAYIEYVLGNT